jgi:orotidine-5'-phosphate decarboxylase
MSMFGETLKNKIDQVGSSLCAGIDPHTVNLPVFMKNSLADNPSSFLSGFSKAIIDASAGKLPAVKFQSSFFEVHGSQGWQVLDEMISYAKSKGLVAILDAKRGDISSTMQAYGQMAFDKMDADILTITPYMGVGTIEPLIPWMKKGRGIYMVWISSNPGGDIVQSLASEAIFDEAVKVIEENEVGNSFGLVVGATKVEGMSQRLFDKSKSFSMLMPGIGAQGGKIENRITELVASKNSTLIPVSRGLAGVGAADQSKTLSELTGWPAYEKYLQLRLAELLANLKV